MMDDRNGSSRHEIDVAIGILMGLRHCSERQAFTEIATAVGETGISLGRICRAIIELASGATCSSDYGPQVIGVWEELVSDRISDVRCH